MKLSWVKCSKLYRMSSILRYLVKNSEQSMYNFLAKVIKHTHNVSMKHATNSLLD